MGWLWSLIIGGIIGWLAGLIVGRDIPGGIIGNIVAGVILGDMGPEMGGFYIVPALIGAIVLVAIVSLIFRSMGRSRG